jgi:hypothetical protein
MFPCRTRAARSSAVPDPAVPARTIHALIKGTRWARLKNPQRHSTEKGSSKIMVYATLQVTRRSQHNLEAVHDSGRIASP